MAKRTKNGGANGKENKTERPSEVLTLTEAGRIFNRSAWTIRRWIEQRLLAAVVLPGGRLGVTRKEIDTYLGSTYQPKE